MKIAVEMCKSKSEKTNRRSQRYLVKHLDRYTKRRDI